MRRVTGLIVLLLILLTRLHAATIHVPKDYSTIGDAIAAASGGDLVLVDPGLYIENIDFLGKVITLRSVEGPEATVIDGGNPANPDYGSVVFFMNGESNDSVLEGFTITNVLQYRERMAGHQHHSLVPEFCRSEK